MNTDKLKDRLEQLYDPTLSMSLKESRGIKHLAFDQNEGLITLIVSMGKLGGEDEKFLRREIARVVKLEFGYKGLRLQVEESKIEQSITKKPIKFIGIISGKGGVGKSSIAANIAYELTRMGKKVGIIDADIYGSSIPTIMEVPHQRPVYDENRKIIPIEKDGIELISTEFFTEESQPVLWRGALLNSMLNHFFYDLCWSEETEYVIIDFPPGTGDIALDIKNIVPQSKMLLVTTPHPSASHVAVKAGTAAKSLGHELIGVIENMSYYVNPVNGEHEYIFGSGGGKEVADDLEVPLIAKLEITQPKHHNDIFEPDESNGKVYHQIAEFIINN